MRVAGRLIAAQSAHAHGQQQTAAGGGVLHVGVHDNGLETRVEQGGGTPVCRLLRADEARERDLEKRMFFASLAFEATSNGADPDPDSDPEVRNSA